MKSGAVRSREVSPGAPVSERASQVPQRETPDLHSSGCPRELLCTWSGCNPEPPRTLRPTRGAHLGYPSLPSQGCNAGRDSGSCHLYQVQRGRLRPGSLNLFWTGGPGSLYRVGVETPGSSTSGRSVRTTVDGSGSSSDTRNHLGCGVCLSSPRLSLGKVGEGVRVGVGDCDRRALSGGVVASGRPAGEGSPRPRTGTEVRPVSAV